MKENYKVLVFPCGSEIGLEVHRSLSYSTHVELWGASSTEDHGKFVYFNYISGLPFISDNRLIDELKKLVVKYRFDAIYPAMDSVIELLKSKEKELGCKVISSPYETTHLCLEKKETYAKLDGIIPVPKTYKRINEDIQYPVFIKPNIGYGSRGVAKVSNEKELQEFFREKVDQEYIISEFLDGVEYTIDCFTNYKGELLFSGVRERKRISNGISVNTIPVEDVNGEFASLVQKINSNIKFRGAWFVQLKRDKYGNLKLLEIASRLGGSSSLYRGKGINFALLSVFDTFEIPIKILENQYKIEMDRALDNCYNIDISFDTVYLDFDDCLFLKGKVNYQLVALLYKFRNEDKDIILISKHKGNLHNKLSELRLSEVCDKVIHLKEEDNKYLYMNANRSIFIDDSFSERQEVKDRLGIPVFDLDMVQVLINS